MTTACTLMTWIIIGLTYIRFRKGIKAQRLERILVYHGKWQPYTAYFATSVAIFALIFK